MRKGFLLLFLITVGVLLLVACGNEKTSNSEEGGTGSDEVKNERFEVVFNTGSPGGGYMVFGNMFSNEWQRQIDNFFPSTVQGQGLTNVVAVETSENGIDMAASFNTILMDALNHTGEFERLLDGPIENLRAVARLNDTAPFLAPTLANRVPEGITTLGEFLETEPSLRLMTRERGTGGEEFVRRVLEAYGYDYETIRSWGGSVTHTTASDGVSAVSDGHADAAWQSYLPHAAILQELESSREVVYLELEDYVVEYLQDNYGYAPFTAPGEWFSNGRELNSARQDTIVYVHKDFPDEIVKEMTKIVLENKEAWVRGQQNFESF